MTEDEKKAAKYRQEAKTGGTDAPVPQSVIQEAADKKAQEKAKQAPTTKTEMGKGFAKGGSASSVLMAALSVAKLVGRSSNDGLSWHGRNPSIQDAGEEDCPP
jgi:hypothetical protein